MIPRAMRWKEDISYNRRDAGSKLTVVYAWLVIFSFLAALATLGFQCFSWLVAGEWKGLSVMDGLERVEQLRGNEREFFQIRDWLEQWNGLRQALEWLPLSGMFAIIGLFCVLLAVTD